ncbi:MAG TPA: hypothetical protein VF412_18680 [Bdellovibrio sp.]|uniref:hypothetical protein n=1 Tax=Bdellovibrio sp. TaxID=28201 RepID=UPI002F16D78D
MEETKQGEFGRTDEREFKIENGDVIKLTEEELQRVVDVFKLLSSMDNKIMMEAVNGSKVDLARLGPEKVKDYVGKYIFVAITVKEQVQLKHWDFYYKLERVKLLGIDRKTKNIRIEMQGKKSIEIEPRGIFVEAPR